MTTVSQNNESQLVMAHKRHLVKLSHSVACVKSVSVGKQPGCGECSFALTGPPKVSLFTVVCHRASVVVQHKSIFMFNIYKTMVRVTGPYIISAPTPNRLVHLK